MSNEVKASRREHPIQLVMIIVKYCKDFWFPMLFMGVYSMFEGKLSWTNWRLYVVLVLFSVLVCQLLQYFFRRFYINEDGVGYYEGIFFKEHIFMPYERMQAIDDKQWFFYRPFKVCEVQIHVAGTEKTLTLHAIKVTEAVEIKQRRTNNFGVIDVNDETEGNSVIEQAKWTVELSVYHTVLEAVLSLKTYVGMFVLLSFITQVSEYYDSHQLEASVSKIISLGFFVIVIVVMGAFIISTLLGILMKLIRHYHFIVSGFADYFVIERGLFQRHRTTINHAKIQAYTLKHNWLMHLLGYTSISVIQAGDDTESSNLIMPLIKKDELSVFFEKIAPNNIFPIVEKGLAPKASLRLFLTRVVWIIIPIMAVMFVISFKYAVYLLIIPVVLGVKCRIEQKHSGYNLAEHVLVFQMIRLWGVEVVYTEKKRVQSLVHRQSVWMKQSGLSHLTITLAEQGAYQLRLNYLKNTDAEKIYFWFRRKS